MILNKSTKGLRTSTRMKASGVSAHTHTNTQTTHTQTHTHTHQTTQLVCAPTQIRNMNYRIYVVEAPKPNEIILPGDLLCERTKVRSGDVAVTKR
jgi:hypothetical protein